MLLPIPINIYKYKYIHKYIFLYPNACIHFGVFFRCFPVCIHFSHAGGPSSRFALLSLLGRRSLTLLRDASTLNARRRSDARLTMRTIFACAYVIPISHRSRLAIETVYHSKITYLLHLFLFFSLVPSHFLRCLSFDYSP